jgi:hypothetical protein
VLQYGDSSGGSHGQLAVHPPPVNTQTHWPPSVGRPVHWHPDAHGSSAPVVVVVVVAQSGNVVVVVDVAPSPGSHTGGSAANCEQLVYVHSPSDEPQNVGGKHWQ